MVPGLDAIADGSSVTPVCFIPFGVEVHANQDVCLRLSGADPLPVRVMWVEDKAQPMTGIVEETVVFGAVQLGLLPKLSEEGR